MPVKTFSAALLALLMVSVPAAAATMSAEIVGHDVHSQFLPGDFIPLPDNQTEVVNPDVSTAPAALEVSGGSPVLPNQTEAPFDDPAPLVNVAPGETSGSSQSGSSLPIISPPGSGTGVGVVPLPGALPMFGLALLVLCGFGARRSFRTTRNV